MNDFIIWIEKEKEKSPDNLIEIISLIISKLDGILSYKIPKNELYAFNQSCALLMHNVGVILIK